MAYAIKAENVSIRYMTGDFKDIGLKEYVLRRLTHNYNVHEFWADKGVTFELQPGDMLGIIGANGAGKSTLLKAVSGIMIPTEGWVDVKGRIAALLELASGFDNDLTVRENAYLRGALLGYTREFMNERYDDIIEFAELQDFQERRFKQLSSGMKSRLAFSIACLVEPDILILDEVLSVGDGAFRKKSENKMRNILASGVTAILVSHTIGQVRDMSNKVLWLDKGKQICFSEEVELVCDAYEEFLATKKVPHSWEDIEQLAEDFTVRQEKKRAEKAKTEQQKLVEKLRKTNANVAKAAIEEYLREAEEEAETE
ncbi:MAG: ABC transporter ATP-binding protein [Lachnospiraceae bacterium]|nr:ABC transporter ATP-binding protein [Lachnospiraceae bacterium]